MNRVLVVAYRPLPGKKEALLELLERQHRHARAMGVLASQAPWLCEGIHGEILYIVGFDVGADVDRLWENEDFQDIDAQIANIATMIPIRSLDEASASFMDLAGLPVRGG